MRLNYLLVFVPIAIALRWMGVNQIVVFGVSALAIVPLAGLMGDATEALGKFLGPTIGGLLNATLGNAPEIIISLFALKRGLIDVVKASITGSIIGNLLFGLGLSMFFGGVKHRKQKFDPEVARINSSLLTLASFGLLVPALYRMSPRLEALTLPELSIEIALILFVVYLASLVYILIAHRPVIGKKAVEAEQADKGRPVEPDLTEEEKTWSLRKSAVVLFATTVALALMSEILTGTIEPAAEKMHLTARFAGIFLLALIGNAAEIFTAIRFARKDKMDLAIGVTIGASSQVALLVAPILVFASVAMGERMNLLFSSYEIWAVVMAVYTTRNLVYDGESNWLEGVLLIALYLMLGVGFYYLPDLAEPTP